MEYALSYLLIYLLTKRTCEIASEIKHGYSSENNVMYDLLRRKRSLCAQISSGILPLCTETGRFAGLEEQNLTCPVCELGDVENEHHFLLICPFCENIHNIAFGRWIWMTQSCCLKMFRLANY